MEKFSFFNDTNNDRVYYAEDFARHLARYFTNGIFDNGCQVLANDDMSVNVSVGAANINGYRYENDEIKKLQIEFADGVLNRIDNIVIRLDLTNRQITAQVIKGSPADNPVAPNLVRDSTIYDLRIATISIPAGTTTITQDLISDRRFFTSECGNVISAVQTPNTEDLFIQIEAAFNKLLLQMNNALNSFNTDSEKLLSDLNDAYQKSLEEFDKLFSNSIKNMNSAFENNLLGYDTSFNNKINFWTQDFNSWFSNIKDILDANTAGHLQNEIDEIKNKDYVEDSDYIHTDNNFSNEYKQKIDANTKNIKENIANIEKIVENGCKSYCISLTMDEWQLDSSDNSYFYNILRDDITEQTDVTISMSRQNKAKFKGLTDVKSFDGGFIITTDEMPEDDIDITIKYMLANFTIGGND